MPDLELFMRACSPWSYLLLAGETMLLAVLIERAVVLFRLRSVRIDAVFPVLEKLIRSGDLPRARKLAAILPPPLPQVFLAGFEAFDGDPGCVAEAARRGVEQALPVVWKRFMRLAAIAAGMLILGVIGTAALSTHTSVESLDARPFGLPLAWAPAAWGGASALVAAAVGGLLALVAWREAERLRELPKKLERLAYDARENSP